jgi:hypothetical protein
LNRKGAKHIIRVRHIVSHVHQDKIIEHLSPDAKAVGLKLRRLKAASKRRIFQFSICFSARFSGVVFS